MALHNVVHDDHFHFLHSYHPSIRIILTLQSVSILGIETKITGLLILVLVPIGLVIESRSRLGSSSQTCIPDKAAGLHKR